MKSPANLPTCKHGIIAGVGCRECTLERSEIMVEISPLIDEFWDNRGARDLRNLMTRAYYMGMKREKS